MPAYSHKLINFYQSLTIKVPWAHTLSNITIKQLLLQFFIFNSYCSHNHAEPTCT